MLSGLKTCLTAARRTLSDGELSVRLYDGRQVQIYEQVRGADRCTPDRLAVRRATSDLAAAWRALGADAKEAWRTAARRLKGEFPLAHGGLTNYMLWSHCALNRLLVGGELPERPPGARRPQPPLELALAPCTNPRTFGFILRHDIPARECGRYRAVVRLTPGTVRAGRAPETRNRRMIRGYGAASAPVLVPSGQALVVDDARFAVEPGRRFGVWVRIVDTLAGLDSGEKFFDLDRTGPPVEEDDARPQPVDWDGASQAADEEEPACPQAESACLSPSGRATIETNRTRRCQDDHRQQRLQHVPLNSEEAAFHHPVFLRYDAHEPAPGEARHVRARGACIGLQPADCSGGGLGAAGSAGRRIPP